VGATYELLAKAEGTDHLRCGGEERNDAHGEASSREAA
jgi:hypothetical protein